MYMALPGLLLLLLLAGRRYCWCDVQFLQHLLQRTWHCHLA
jgi:hypothetical protein